MKDQQFLDEIRRKIQASLAESEREPLSPEEDAQKFMDDLFEFDRQLEEAPRITVRERIGNPNLEPAAEIPPFALEEAVNTLFELLGEHDIVVDFMGEWDDLAMYRYITEELLNEEMEDIRVKGYVSCFEATTPEYDVQMWVDIFVGELFWEHRENFLPNMDKQPIYDTAGNPITLAKFGLKVEMVWAKLPPNARPDTTPITTQVIGDKGTVTAVISWHHYGEQKQVKSFFHLQPSPYFGWDIVQTSLLDDILVIV